MGWLIDPDEQTVFVYAQRQDFGIVEILDQPSSILHRPPFAEELQLSVGELFAWLSTQ